jgi:enoyl-[acyl-carrier protein] reductase II
MSFLESSMRALRAARAMGMPLRPILSRLRRDPERIRLLAYFGASLPLVEAATIQGNLDEGVQFIGQSQGLVDDIPSAAEVVERVVREAEALIKEHASAAWGDDVAGDATPRVGNLHTH